MTDQNQMPMFEDPIPPQEAPAPKKPRQKPTRKRKMPKAEKGAAMRMPAAKKRRKRRVAKEKITNPAGDAMTTSEVFMAMTIFRTLATLTPDRRKLVMDVLKGAL